MAWKKVSPEVTAFLDAAMAPLEAERRTMFGCPCYFVNGNMFIGAFEDRLFIRLSEADRAALAAAYLAARPFEPMPGMRMREYLEIPGAVRADEAAFEDWLQRGLRYIRGLPLKERKPGKATRKKPASS